MHCRCGRCWLVIGKVIVLIQNPSDILGNRAQKPSHTVLQIPIIISSHHRNEARRTRQIRQSLNIQIGTAVQIVYGSREILFAAHEQHRFAAQPRLHDDVGEELASQHDALVIGAVDQEYGTVCLLIVMPPDATNVLRTAQFGQSYAYAVQFDGVTLAADRWRKIDAFRACQYVDHLGFAGTVQSEQQNIQFGGTANAPPLQSIE